MGEATRNSLVACLYIFGIVTILLGIMGWYGGYKKNTFLLAIYNLGNAIFLLTFTAIALGALIFSNKFESMGIGTNIILTSDECVNEGWSKDIRNTTQVAGSRFCRIGCTCYIDTAKFPENYFLLSGLVHTNLTQVLSDL
jgi:hypothetical protein